MPGDYKEGETYFAVFARPMEGLGRFGADHSMVGPVKFVGGKFIIMNPNLIRGGHTYGNQGLRQMLFGPQFVQVEHNLDGATVLSAVHDPRGEIDRKVRESQDRLSYIKNYNIFGYNCRSFTAYSISEADISEEAKKQLLNKAFCENSYGIGTELNPYTQELSNNYQTEKIERRWMQAYFNSSLFGDGGFPYPSYIAKNYPNIAKNYLNYLASLLPSNSVLPAQSSGATQKPSGSCSIF